MKYVYRIKHIPTGLFWKPATGYTHQRTNLSPAGKIYIKKPAYVDYAKVNRLQIEKYNISKDSLDKWDRIHDGFEVIKYELVPCEIKERENNK